MKFAPALLVLSTSALVLSACGSSGGGDDAKPNKKVAKKADGTCTPEVIADVEQVKQTLANTMSKLTSDAREYAQQRITSGEMERRAQQHQETSRNAVMGLRSTYGDIDCTYQSGGYVYRINSAELYKAVDLDPSKEQLSEAPAPVMPVGPDADCPPDVVRDHQEMMTSARTPMAEMLEIAQQAISGGQTSYALKLKMRTATASAISIFESFRAKHPGEFVCNVTNDGKRIVVSSQQLDEGIAKMRDQMNQLE